MKPDNWNRFAAGLLAILLCLCSFSMPAFASGTDPAPEPLPEIIEEEPTTGGMEPEGVPITPKGNATLVDDFYGDKQLITVTTKAGNYYYILIDRANEDKETSVHFLNQVDDADLLALLDEEPQETEVCTCTVKCEAGNVNENCPLCEKSLRNCTAPEAVKTDTETPQEKPKSNMGSLMILLVLALAGGGAALYYFKFRKPKADTTGTMIWTNTILARTKMQTRNLLKSRFIRRMDRRTKHERSASNCRKAQCSPQHRRRDRGRCKAKRLLAGRRVSCQLVHRASGVLCGSGPVR